MSSQPDSHSRRPSAQGVVVVSSSEMDAHLHEEAEELARVRHQALTLSPWRSEILSSDPVLSTAHEGEEGEKVEGLQDVEWCEEDDDVMTPPSVLLDRALRQANIYTRQKQAEDAVRQWVRCAALSRIVHGESHWQRGRCHVHLAKTYLDLRNLSEQALSHAEKGRGILLSGGDHLTSCDADPQAVLALALAHCIVGRVLTTQGKLPEAEKALQKSRRTLERCGLQRSRRTPEMCGRAPASSNPATDLELDIASAIGRLRCKQGNYNSAKDWFTKAVERCKVSSGVKHQSLVPLLKELASAEVMGGEKDRAVHTLEEALEIAEASGGSGSEVTGSVLLALARAHTPTPATPGVAKEYFERACSVYTAVCGAEHENAIKCKEDFCHYLMSQKGTKEEAVSLLREIIQLKNRLYGDHSLQLGHSYKWLGAAYLSMNNVDMAKKSLLKAKVIFASNCGEKHKETVNIVQTLEIISGSESRDMPAVNRVEERPRFKTVV